MTLRRALVLGLMLAATAGCPKGDPGKEGGAQAASGSIASTGTGTSAAAGVSASASAGVPTGPKAFAGSYKAAPQLLHMPDFTGTKWRGDDAGIALGEGKISISLLPDGRVMGTMEAPLGPSTIYGTHADGRVSATVRGEVGDDKAWVGTLSATATAGKLEGVLTMSSSRGNVARQASFSLESEK
jgi:hypothetical protein